YNETENVANPKKYNPAVASKTENDGAYRIPDIILANTYYVYAFVPERPVYFRRVYISSNSMTGIDFDIMPSTPTLKVTMKRTESQNVFRFIIESPRPLVAPPECYYSPGAVFNALRKVRALPTAGAKNTFTVDVEIPSTSEEEYYTLSIKAQYGMTDYMTEELNFSQKFLAKAKKEVADELAEGGSILIDDERSDNTEVMLDPGTLTSDEMVNLPIGGFLTALPNFKMSKMGRDISTLIDSAMQGIAASEVYEIGLEKAQVNKSFDVTLNYDRNKVTEEDIADLKIYKYNDATGKWEAMSGIMSLDPLTGTISVETDTLLPADAQKSAPKTVVKNGVFAINKAVSATQSGAFAVFKQDPNTAKIYAGSEFTVINFPNPFDLKTKTVNMQDVNSAPSQTITGTMLKYTLPANKSGKIKLYIYNLAGELVRELDEGDKTGGFYYYTEWDGRNDNGEECASGIYFLIAKRNDSKISSKPHKIAILK
ncbi:MAG: hypothetical protein JW803_06170, partial [Endomicrobiales bacterium]|nr:hypothetical protein [Endomicrobiales bacterium]